MRGKEINPIPFSSLEFAPYKPFRPLLPFREEYSKTREVISGRRQEIESEVSRLIDTGDYGAAGKRTREFLTPDSLPGDKGLCHELLAHLSLKNDDTTAAESHVSLAVSYYQSINCFPNFVRLPSTFLFIGRAQIGTSYKDYESALNWFRLGLQIEPANALLQNGILGVQTLIQHKLQAPSASSFHVPLAVSPPAVTIISVKDSYGILAGTLTDVSGTRDVSLVPLDINIDVHTFPHISALSSCHESLLTCLHLIEHPGVEIHLLVTDKVVTFDEYFQQRVNAFRQEARHAKPDWWAFIGDELKMIYRSVVKALMFLYNKKQRACGNLYSSLYFTPQGEVRILASVTQLGLNKSEQEKDLNSLLLRLKTLLTCAFPGDEEVDVQLRNVFNIPEEVIDFFNFSSGHKYIPVEYRLHHPFAWTVAEKIVYPNVLKKFLFGDSSRMLSLDIYLSGHNHFSNWARKLQGHDLYVAIWKKGDPSFTPNINQLKLFASTNAITVSPYDTRVSIVRYFDAVTDHINDNIYRPLRGAKRKTESEVVQFLSQLYPDFYYTMYKAVGLSFDQESLMELYNKPPFVFS